MRTLRYILTLFVFLPVALPLFAQRETIRMKDGTEYTGYISRQNYADGTGEITYSRITRSIAIEDILSRQTDNREVEKLSAEWLEWAQANDKLETLREVSYLPLTIMAVKGDVTRDYYVLLSGSKEVRCFSISGGKANISMGDIEYVRKPERDNTLLTDIDDVVQTETRTYTGVIREQQPGARITIWNNADRSLYAIDYAEIRSVGKSAFNPDYSIWEQSACLEKLHFKAGWSTEPGLIMENGFGADINLLFAVPVGKGSELRQYKYEDIASVEKMPNPGYAPRYDIILQEGEARINRDSTLVAADILSLGDYFYLNPEKTDAMAVVTAPEVCVETHMSGIAEVYVAKAQESVQPQSVYEAQRNGLKVPKPKKGEPTVTLEMYTYKSLFESEVEVTRSESINGTVKLAFTLPEPGVWFVYLRKKNLCWVISYPPEEQKEKEGE